MRKYATGKGAFLKGTLFASLVLLMALMFHACQQEEVLFNTQGPPDAGAAILNNGLNQEIFLDYPEEVNAGEDFDITFSSTCGKIMIERGFTAEFDEYGAIISKVYTGLTCDTENLLWEAVGDDVFETCPGKTITQNLAEGTYMYRAKLNFKAIRGSGCSDCAAFVGNKVECFMITVVAGNQNEGTFTDARDGKVYKWVKIGNQIWMAENLAYNMEGSYDAGTYGRMYNWDAAKGGAAPEGWRLPSNADWQELIAYINTNGYGCEGAANIARALAAPESGWEFSITPGAPGYPACTANTSGFSALPSGYLNTVPDYVQQYRMTFWWSSDVGTYDNTGYAYWLTYGSPLLNQQVMSTNVGFSIRCIKNPD